MARDWHPTPAERAATDAALWTLQLGGSMWRDDCRQAALLALWKTSDGRDRHHRGWSYRIALRAATDELRRVTGARKDPRGWHPASAWHEDTPERRLAARQGLAILLGLPDIQRRAVSAVLLADTRREAARSLGIDPARINHLLDRSPRHVRRPSVREALAAAV